MPVDEQQLPSTIASAVDALALRLRREILDGRLQSGSRLVERALVESHGVARHTLRAALRALASEGLVTLTPNAGARVAVLGPEEAAGLYELRTALEVEACRLALQRDPAALEQCLDEAADELATVCAVDEPAWSAVADAHAGVHRALVDCAHSPRLSSAYATLEGELRLFLVALRPEWTLERMADAHCRLGAELRERGESALRDHLADGARSTLGA